MPKLTGDTRNSMTLMGQITKEEFIKNPPSGFVYSATLREGLLAYRRTDKTTVGDAFFKLPAEERLSLLRHEEGHDLMRNFNRDWKDVLEPIRKNKEQPLGAKSRWNNPFGLSDRAEELVADAYASLWDGSTKWFDDPNFPTNKILKQVIEIARREGKPLPAESAIQFVPELNPPAVEGPVVPEVKEPWQMTIAEYVRPPYTSPAMHKFGVEKALREGKPVPSEVLAEYPDLKPPAVEQSNPPPASDSFKTLLAIGLPLLALYHFIKKARNKHSQ